MELINKKVSIALKEGNISELKGDGIEIKDGVYISKIGKEVEMIIPLSNIAYIKVEKKYK